jgi:hypothetical protein
MRIAIVVAVLALASTAAFAQTGLIQQGRREFRPPPETLETPPADEDAIVAARGNVQRWRDAERARIGGFSRENHIENQRLSAAYGSALATQLRRPARQREPVAEPVYLPTGPLLPAISGYYAYFYEADGVPRRTVVMGVWNDPRSNAGEASTVRAAATFPDVFCGDRRIPLADLAYLGPPYTQEIAALNRAWLGPLPGPPMLSGADVSFTRKPAGALFARYYPVRALQREMEGNVYMLCDIGADALACAVTEEEPAGWGLGEAALRIAAEGYRVAPVLQSGEPAIGRKLCLGTAFRLE